jgi:VanZ family protein
VGPDETLLGAPPTARALFHVAFWIPLMICTYLALAPDLPQSLIMQADDALLHGAAFTYLSLALVLLSLGSRFERRMYLRTVLVMLGYGVLLELLQGSIPQRTAELSDLLADCAGIGVGLLLSRLAARAVHRRVCALSGQVGLFR